MFASGQILAWTAAFAIDVDNTFYDGTIHFRLVGRFTMSVVDETNDGVRQVLVQLATEHKVTPQQFLRKVATGLQQFRQATGEVALQVRPDDGSDR